MTDENGWTHMGQGVHMAPIGTPLPKEFPQGPAGLMINPDLTPAREERREAAIDYAAQLGRNVTHTLTFKIKGTPAGHRRFWRLFSGEPTYRYPGGPPLIHKGKKP